MSNSTFFEKTKYGIVWCSTYQRFDFKGFAQETNDGRWCEHSNGCVYPIDILFWSEDETLVKVILVKMQNDIKTDEDMNRYADEIKVYKTLEAEKRVQVIQNTIKEFSVSHAEHFI